ncbi:MAG: patatin-like phospholipase family protein, partial [Candidatus Methylomirabilis sp.]|nr:patatin-like phospholipase family protein [Deltaproteobacteria bacterium]
MRRGAAFAALALWALASGCYTLQRINSPLKAYDRDGGYRPSNAPAEGRSRELLVVLTFSGGGTRAAALAFGVLEELRRTRITAAGERRRLLDEVDMISSVSGGSFTSAYYALEGERAFHEFPKRFLYASVENELIDVLVSAKNFGRLLFTGTTRLEL